MTTKSKVLQVRLSDAEDQVLEELTRAYGVDRSTLIRFALTHVQEEKPVFKVAYSETRHGYGDLDKVYD